MYTGPASTVSHIEAAGAGISLYISLHTIIYIQCNGLNLEMICVKSGKEVIYI